jgi:hypothetical protein
MTSEDRKAAVDALYRLGVGANLRPEHQSDLIHEVIDAVIQAMPAQPTEVEWGFQSPIPGLWYVTQNDMLIETMQAGRPEAVVYKHRTTPWVEK